MPSIPEEICFAILSRLPLKSILVCRCVCKTWFSVISDPVFVNMHLYNAQRNNSKLVITSYDRSKHKHVMYSIGYEALSLTSTEIEDEDDVMEVPYPTVHNLISSCNGLVCLRCHDETRSFFCLWNPATTEYKKMPGSPCQCALHEIQAHALCYDWKTDDYKIVVVALRGSITYSVDVYTLRSNTWKNSQIFLPYRFWSEGKIGVLANGALHWSGKKPGNGSSWLIICLDTTEEKLKELQLPKEPLKNKHWSTMTLGVLGGCLGVIVSAVTPDFEVWVMRDYGIQESWTKSCIINRERIHMLGDNLSLVGSFKDGSLLLSNWGKLIIYDTKNSRGRDPKRRGSLMHYKAENYIESLVSLNSGIYMGRRYHRAKIARKRTNEELN